MVILRYSRFLKISKGHSVNNELHSGRQHIDPRLLVLMDQAEKEESLDMRVLRKNDVVSLQTMNTLYTMLVLDPERGTVMVSSNGSHISDVPRAGSVMGTTLTGTGTMVKLRTIVLNLRLCLFVEGLGQLRLSRTQSVSVNGVKIIPMDRSQKPN
ncbi:MAG TPA: hypothetical protein VJC06_00595 [Candidatus Paceibacterota bacterium]